MLNYLEADDDDFAEIFGEAIRHIAIEPVVLKRLEKYFLPTPAKLAGDSDGAALQARLHSLIESLGGPPRLVIRRHGDESKETVDYYPLAAISEVVNLFHRARKSVCRAQMVAAGSQAIETNPEILQMPDGSPIPETFVKGISSAFWEHAEMAYIRLASYWDRVGQLLDFIFFGIRQFEKDGFTSVMDRIAVNFIPRYIKLREAREWKTIRAFQTSERPDGLKWLLRRRNLLIHSLYLRPITAKEDSALFESEFNHLDDRLRNRLKPGTPTEEIEWMNTQLKRAAELFPIIVSTCELMAQLKNETLEDTFIR